MFKYLFALNFFWFLYVYFFFEQFVEKREKKS